MVLAILPKFENYLFLFQFINIKSTYIDTNLTMLTTTVKLITKQFPMWIACK